MFFFDIVIKKKDSMIYFTNDTHREKTVFYSFHYKNGYLAASDLFHISKESIKFYTFHYHILRVQMFEKCDSSNR